MPQRLQEVLEQHYGIFEATVTRLHGGHTNLTYQVAARGRDFILRQSWPGRHPTRLQQEETVLAALGALPVPHIVRTLDGQRHVYDEAGALHVFEVCPGQPGKAWLDPDDLPLMRAGMINLAQLHRHLRSVRCEATDPSAWLRERLARINAKGTGGLPKGSAVVLHEIERLIRSLSTGPVQWLHGDYHLGNLLWDDGRVVGVVDFEDTACGTSRSEAMMALFALARQDNGEESFTYDRGLWAAGQEAYVNALEPCDAPAWQTAEDWERLFCGYQVLVHLEAAQHGLWSLGAGIGFWPCWHRLLEVD